MTDFGRTLITTTGQPVRCSYDGQPEWKAGGITIDWSTIAAPAADTTLTDGAVIKAGYKGLQFGTILTKITASGKYGPYTPAMVATTLNGATAVGALTATLTAVTNILPGDSLTIDTAGAQEVAQVLSVNGFVVTFVTPLANAHLTGVAVTKANDGRQTLTPGECFVLDASVLQSNPYNLFMGATDHPAVLDGGQVWLSRLAVGGTNQPTVAQLLAVCPRLRFVEA